VQTGDQLYLAIEQPLGLFRDKESYELDHEGDFALGAPPDGLIDHALAAVMEFPCDLVGLADERSRLAAPFGRLAGQLAPSEETQFVVDRGPELLARGGITPDRGGQELRHRFWRSMGHDGLPGRCHSSYRNCTETGA